MDSHKELWNDFARPYEGATVEWGLNKKRQLAYELKRHGRFTPEIEKELEEAVNNYFRLSAKALLKELKTRKGVGKFNYDHPIKAKETQLRELYEAGGVSIEPQGKLDRSIHESALRFNLACARQKQKELSNNLTDLEKWNGSFSGWYPYFYFTKEGCYSWESLEDEAEALRCQLKINGKDISSKFEARIKKTIRKLKFLALDYEVSVVREKEGDVFLSAEDIETDEKEFRERVVETGARISDRPEKKRVGVLIDAEIREAFKVFNGSCVMETVKLLIRRPLETGDLVEDFLEEIRRKECASARQFHDYGAAMPPKATYLIDKHVQKYVLSHEKMGRPLSWKRNYLIRHDKPRVQTNATARAQALQVRRFKDQLLAMKEQRSGSDNEAPLPDKTVPMRRMFLSMSRKCLLP